MDRLVKILTIPVHSPTDQDLRMMAAGVSPRRYLTRKEAEKLFPEAPKLKPRKKRANGQPLRNDTP